MLEAVRDDLRDADDVQIVLGGNDLELGHASHRAVGVHDLAEDRGRLEASQASEVDRRFGLARSNEHAASLRAQREHVAGAGEVRRTCSRVD